MQTSSSPPPDRDFVVGEDGEPVSSTPDKYTRRDPVFFEGGAPNQVFLFDKFGFKYGTDDKGHAAALVLAVFLLNRLCTWLRFDQHAVGKGFCIGGEAEERAESSVAGFAAVEAKDELIEIGLQMLATQPVVDASRPSFEVGEDLVDPRQDEVSGGLPDDMDIVAIGGGAQRSRTSRRFSRWRRDRRRFRRSVRGRRRRRRRFRPAAGGLGCFRPRVRWRRR